MIYSFIHLPLNFDNYIVALFCHPISLQSLVLQHYQMLHLPLKKSKRLKLPGLRPNFCQISIVRQHTKYKDYKPNQKCEDVNISIYCCSLTTACYCYMQLGYSCVKTGRTVAYILIRFLCNTGSRESSIYFSTPTPTPDSGKILFSTPTLTLTPRKNLRLPRLRLQTPTLQHCWPHYIF